MPFIGFDGVNVEGFSSRSTATMRLSRRLTVARYILGRVFVFARAVRSDY